MDDNIYFISNYDNQVHNINDVEHRKVNSDICYIGFNTTEGFRVDEEVGLLTLKDIKKL